MRSFFGRYAEGSAPTPRSPRSLRQVYQVSLAGLLGIGEGVEGRAPHLDRGSIQIERSPRGYEAGPSVKAGTGLALGTDHKRKATAARAPYFQILHRTDDAAELHDAIQQKLPAHWNRTVLSLIRKCSAAVFPSVEIKSVVGAPRGRII